jgi:leucine dehydrogenase
MTDLALFDDIGHLGLARLLLWSDPPSGLRALAAIDDVTLGPACGGIRTRSYPSLSAAVRDAAALARAMTRKTALAGLDAGGCKIVVLDHPGLDRPAAFARLGQLVEELGGLIRSAGDLGTTAEDLEAAAAHTRFVNTSLDDLSAATARTLVRAAEACAAAKGRGGLAGLSIAVQGCGAIGAAAARALAAAGARLVVADLDGKRAEAIAREVGGRVAAPDAILFEEVDLVAPCAVGGVLTVEVAERIRAWAVCGAANNVLAEPAAEARLRARGILFVPDVIASSGAVIVGVATRVMDIANPTPLLDAVGETASEVLAESASTGRLASDVAADRAAARIARGRRA